MLEGFETELLEQTYFEVEEKNNYFYKIKSVAAKTEWIILKTEVPNDSKPIVVYCKDPKKKDKNFKLISVEKNVEAAVTQIKRFDTLVK